MPKPPIFFNRLDSVKSVIGGDLTNISGVTFSSGLYGNAAYFDGSGKYLFYAMYVPSNAWTYEGWFYSTTDSGTRRLFATAWTGSNLVSMRLESTQLVAHILSGTQSAVHVLPGTWTGKSNAWQHVACTWDGTTSKVWLNGSVISSLSLGGTFSSPNTFAIGAYPSAGEYWVGRIDNFKIYDYAKADFSDRFNERGGMNDAVILL